MEDIPVAILFSTLTLLIFASAFFSGTETGMMAINRYKLKNAADKGDKAALRVKKLLDRPDRLIGVILIGNNFVNIFAATIATLIAMHYFGTAGVAIAPVALTIVILIFSEVTPKTLAATHPEKFAFPASLILIPLLWLLYPFVWLVNIISNGLLRLMGIDTRKNNSDQLSREELRTVVNEAGGMIPDKHQGMLLNILDLEKITVDDIMIPRNEMTGLDIDDDIDDILKQISASQHTRLPVYKGNHNNMLGIFHLRKSAKLIDLDNINKAVILQHTIEPFFVPKGTPLHTQLINFQAEKRRIGIIVNEYGDVQGIVTLEDILEEIVGEFTTDFAATNKDIHPQEDGTFMIDGSTHIRDINRTLNISLPTDGPKTLNGLIIEYLEDIPESNVSIKIKGYGLEVVHIKGNFIKTAKLFLPKKMA